MYQIFQKDKPVNLKTVNRIAIAQTLKTSFPSEDMTKIVEVFPGGRVATPDLSYVANILELNPVLKLFVEVENTFSWVLADLREVE